MGKTLSKEEQEQKEVNELRTKVIKLFQGQQLLFVGTIGSGKSSFVNTVNHALNLVDPKVPYQELARIGATDAVHGTMTYRTYTMKKGLFQSLKSQVPDPSNAPRLFDIAGVTEQLLQKDNFDFKQVLVYLIQGKVKELTQMIKLYNSKQQLQEIGKQEEVEENKVWIMVCVVSLYDPFPQLLLEQVASAVQELEPQNGGTSVFVVLTKGDRLDSVDRSTRVKNFSKRCQTVLNIMEKRIFEVNNYLPSELKIDATTTKNLEKEKSVVAALNFMLQPAFIPDSQK